MSESSVKLRFLLDEGVPVSVATVLKENGHEVLPHWDVLARGSPDLAVCAAAEINDCILVACDKDMKQIAKRSGVTGSRFSKLSLLQLSCFEPIAAPRVKEALSLILHEWEVGATRERRLFVIVGDAVIRTNR